MAFYTDQIPTPAGPGTLYGFPGMILGLIVPAQHFNIHATKVYFAPPTLKTARVRKKDKPMPRKETWEKRKDVMDRWMGDRPFDMVMAGMLL